MSAETREDLVHLLYGVGAGILVDLAHSVAWRAFLRRAYGDPALAVVTALLSATPLVVTFTASLLLLSRRLTLRRGVAVFLVLALTNLVQSVVGFELAFPGMLPPVALVGRGLGILLSPLAFAAGAIVAAKRSPK